VYEFLLRQKFRDCIQICKIKVNNQNDYSVDINIRMRYLPRLKIFTGSNMEHKHTRVLLWLDAKSRAVCYANAATHRRIAGSQTHTTQHKA
jgi:hypothetical protein